MMITIKDNIEAEITCNEEHCYVWGKEYDGRSKKVYCSFLDSNEYDWNPKKFGQCTLFNCNIFNKLNIEYNYYMSSNPLRTDVCINTEKIMKIKKILQ
jgi:hypothetical protein